MWKLFDAKQDEAVWQTLQNKSINPDTFFDRTLVEDLPEPAQRYFLFTIKSGTPLKTVSEISMHGEIGLGTKEKPNYQAMHAKQILAPPYGLVWKLNTGKGVMHISGSDGIEDKKSWVHFWLMKTIPIVRVGGNDDHARAAFGRVVAEVVFWAPATLLPQFGATWEIIDIDTARATVIYQGTTQTVDVTVDKNGKPIMVIIPRWSNANPQKEYKLQPFGGYLSEFKEFEGYTLATHVEGGNFIGEKGYFPFYKADVDTINFVNR